jgi:adenosylcobinamide-phosphate synthase
MIFLCVLAALVIDHLRPLIHPSLFELWFVHYANRLSRDLNAGEAIHGTIAWVLAILPWLLVILFVHYAFRALSPLLAWGWDAVVLYACINFKRTLAEYGAITDALRAGNLDEARGLLARWRAEPTANWTENEIAKAAIETAFVRAHRELLAVVAWFVVLPGAAGALLYKLAATLAEKWGRRKGEEYRAFGTFAAQAFHVIDWVPLRLTAMGFAIAGDFEDAVQCWRAQFRSWMDPDAGVILASGAGALGVRLGGPLPKEGGVIYRPELGLGDDPDANYMQSAIGLIWRTLVIWMIVLLLLTIANWARL